MFADLMNFDNVRRNIREFEAIIEIIETLEKLLTGPRSEASQCSTEKKKHTGI